MTPKFFEIMSDRKRGPGCAIALLVVEDADGKQCDAVVAPISCRIQDCTTGDYLFSPQSTEAGGDRWRKDDAGRESTFQADSEWNGQQLEIRFGQSVVDSLVARRSANDAGDSEPDYQFYFDLGSITTSIIQSVNGISPSRPGSPPAEEDVEWSRSVRVGRTPETTTARLPPTQHPVSVDPAPPAAGIGQSKPFPATKWQVIPLIAVTAAFILGMGVGLVLAMLLP